MQCFYSDNYHFPLPAGHPFPMHKYADSKEQLLLKHVIAQEDLIDAGLADISDIERVHSKAYIDAITTGSLDKTALRRLGFAWSERLYIRSLASVNGTIKAAKSALAHGLSANLAGGTHHAFRDRGEGYCVFNDVAVAAYRLRHEHKSIKIMIVDLDAHQGNGTNAITRDEDWVYTYSIHVGSNYPSRKEAGTRDLPVDKFVDGATYLALLKETLPQSLNEFDPDFCFYIAGADVHANDRFGQMSLSTTEMAERDQYTIDEIRNRQLPLAIVYGGGYNRDKDLTTALHVQTIAIAANKQTLI